MSKLSLIPKGVVIAMQASLVALILLAVVPIALGGLEVDAGDPEIDYSDYALTVTLEGDAHSDLYFEISIRYNVSITSGGEMMLVYGSDSKTIPRNGNASIDMDAKIPLTSVIMMMLLCVDESDMIMTVEARASTLGGMLTLSAGTDTVIADEILSVDNKGIAVTGADIENFTELKTKFTLPSSDLSDSIFGKAAGSVLIKIGGFECRMDWTYASDDYTITVNIDGTGSSVIDDINSERNADGSVGVSYDGTSSSLTSEQTDLIVRVLSVLYERWS